MKRLVACMAAFALVVGSFGLADSGSGYRQAEQFALRVDRALDALEEPEFEANDLALAWPLEIAPYLQYEGLTVRPVNPAVIFEPFPGDRHSHIAGYTFCGNEFFLNLRYINWISSWYNDVSSLATLVHEMVHTAGGDFCAWNSEIALPKALRSLA